MCLTKEPMLVSTNPQPPAQFLGAGPGYRCCSQYDQVRLDLQRKIRQCIHAPDRDPSIGTDSTAFGSSGWGQLGLLENFGGFAPNIEHIVILHRPLDKLFVALSLAANVYVKDRCLAVRHLLFEEHRLFGHVHATYLGAIGHVQFWIPGASALYPDDLIWRLAI